MPLAAEIPIRAETHSFDLDAADEALKQVKASTITGAAVLKV